ncbi:MAG: alpha/beta fold hydrolase [Deltaproteobacteria bacterium]|nr:alpha/beta fold hydrolase [Deltaproteobacteria bacterium]
MRWAPLLLLAACQGSFDESICPFRLHASQVQGESVRCGILRTAEFHDAPARYIDVPVVVFKGTSARATPVFTLNGGPGQSWADLGLDSITRQASQQSGGDRVFIEQRGTGIANPRLACGVQNDGETDEAYVRRCNAAWAARAVDVSAFNTRELAGDVDTLRQALGYEKIVLIGVSYGTGWAQEVLRRYGEHLHAVVLDSVVSPQSPPLGETAIAIDEAFTALFQACAADATCKTRFGGLEAKMLETLALLTATPLEVKGKEPFTAEVFFSAAMALLSAEPKVAPRFIDELHTAAKSGSLRLSDTFAALLESNDAATSSLAFGQYMSVACSDNQFVDRAKIDADAARLRPAFLPHVGDAGHILALCDLWSFRRRPAEDFAIVASSVPVLLFAGALDPRTPPRWAMEVGLGLTKAQLVVVPHAGHNVLGSGLDCVAEAMDEFSRTLKLAGKPCDGIPFVVDAPSRAVQPLRLRQHVSAPELMRLLRDF